jgi:hypothetical protein
MRLTGDALRDQGHAGREASEIAEADRLARQRQTIRRTMAAAKALSADIAAGTVVVVPSAPSMNTVKMNGGHR